MDSFRSPKVVKLEQQNEELLAQVEEFSEAAFSVGILLNTILNDPDVCGETKLGVVNWFTANPDQSLDSLKARIEAETIERCADAVLKEADFPIGLISSDKNEMLKRILDDMRKYSGDK